MGLEHSRDRRGQQRVVLDDQDAYPIKLNLTQPGLRNDTRESRRLTGGHQPGGHQQGMDTFLGDSTTQSYAMLSD